MKMGSKLNLKVAICLLECIGFWCKGKLNGNKSSEKKEHPSLSL